MVPMNANKTDPKKQDALCIRRARIADIAMIEALYRDRVRYDTQQKQQQWTMQEVCWTSFSTLYTIQDCYVGVYQNRIVCCMFIVDEDVLYWKQQKKGMALYLHKLVVHPAYAKQGFADSMISYYKQKGANDGLAMVCLDVKEHKMGIRRLYERHGFQLQAIKRFFPDYRSALYVYSM